MGTAPGTYMIPFHFVLNTKTILSKFVNSKIL